MKLKALLILASVLMASPAIAEVPDGSWSSALTTNPITITAIRSNTTESWIKLSGISNGCGDSAAAVPAGLWVIALDDTVKSRFKHSLLVSAFTSKKPVDLRCEGLRVSDIWVLE